MNSMFEGSAFEGDISSWNLAKVEKGRGPGYRRSVTPIIRSRKR